MKKYYWWNFLVILMIENFERQWMLTYRKGLTAYEIFCELLVDLVQGTADRND